MRLLSVIQSIGFIKVYYKTGWDKVIIAIITLVGTWRFREAFKKLMHKMPTEHL